MTATGRARSGSPGRQNEISEETEIGEISSDVRRGLTAPRKALPPYLFYDEAGSALYEQITELPEYYPTRVERRILEAHAAEIVRRTIASGETARQGSSREAPEGAARGGARKAKPLGVVELGAGSASKTQAILRAVLERQENCNYIPIDVSAAALEDAERSLRLALPRVRVQPLVMTHARAVHVLRTVESPQLVLFIGSSVGNLEDADAVTLLRSLRGALGVETSLLLGTDLRKSASVLIPAYDDAAGVTAAFNKNVLVRINRELGGHFELDRFRHVARWNEAASRIEMHLESIRAQDVAIDRLSLRVHFDAGETIHTESSIKYDLPRVERLLTAGGFGLDATFYDDARLFAVHLARAV